jgi:hypothetical protein
MRRAGVCKRQKREDRSMLLSVILAGVATSVPFRAMTPSWKIKSGSQSWPRGGAWNGFCEYCRRPGLGPEFCLIGFDVENHRVGTVFYNTAYRNCRTQFRKRDHRETGGRASS